LPSLTIFNEYKNHWSDNDQNWPMVVEVEAGGENHARDGGSVHWRAGVGLLLSLVFLAEMAQLLDVQDAMRSSMHLIF
jgi:hypothetical protein